jgi:hypothetical protein
MRTLFVSFLFAPLLAVAACGGSSREGRTSLEQAQIDRTAVEGRLRGTWRLVNYQPEVALDAMTQQLLLSQLQTMQVRFESGRLQADSPTFHISRALQISDVAGSLFKLTATDENGVMLTSSCQLSDDGTTITFRGETEPWRGLGTLKRE